jgi:uncharacterized membrane protein YbhN (UPF0104 family)
MVPRLRSPLVWGPISLALLAIVIWRSRLLESGSVLATTRPGPLLAALLLSLLPPLLWAIRSSALLSASGNRVPIAALIPMTTFANTINNLTPGSVGELARLYLLRAHHGVDYATGGAVILIERLVSIGYLVVSALLAWLAIQHLLPEWILLLASIALVAVPGIAYRWRLRPIAWFLAEPLRRLGGGRWPGAIAGLVAAEERIGRLLTDPVSLGRFALVTAAIFAISSVQLVLVAAAFDVTLAPLAAWGALGLSITAGVISLLPFGLGAADLALVGLLGVLGVEPATAAAIAFGYRLVSTLPIALLGVASYAWLSARLPAGGLEGAADAARSGLGTVSAGEPDGPR